MVTQAMANQSRKIGAPWLRVKRAIESENGPLDTIIERTGVVRLKVNRREARRADKDSDRNNPESRAEGQGPARARRRRRSDPLQIHTQPTPIEPYLGVLLQVYEEQEPGPRTPVQLSFAVNA